MCACMSVPWYRTKWELEGLQSLSGSLILSSICTWSVHQKLCGVGPDWPASVLHQSFPGSSDLKWVRTTWGKESEAPIRSVFRMEFAAPNLSWSSRHLVGAPEVGGQGSRHPPAHSFCPLAFCPKASSEWEVTQ